MAAEKTDKAQDWLRLIKRDARGTAVAPVLRKHGKGLDKVNWIHGTGRLALTKAGVYLYLWKPGTGKMADISVVGVEFCVSGMRGGASYAGKIPFRLLPFDSLENVERALRPRKFEIAENRRMATAADDWQRFIAYFDSRERLTALCVMSTFSMRRHSGP